MQMIGLAGKARAGKDTVADYLVETYGFLKYSFSDFVREEVAAAYALTDSEKSMLTDEATKEIDTPRLALPRCSDACFVTVAAKLIDEEAIATTRAPYLPPPRRVSLSPRQVQIWWGTEYRRGQDPDYWVKKADVFVDAFIEARERSVTKKDQKSISKQLFPSWQEGDTLLPAGHKYYLDHPGLVNSSVRFENEATWIRSRVGNIWHIQRPGHANAERVDSHVSEAGVTIRTGDKLIINASSVARLRTCITGALQGESVINTSEE